jgi:HhH-GPD superfamily base excision DNA repair protein
VPERLHFTDSDEANALIAGDPMALLIGFALDQQVSVQKAFSGPLVLRERLGTIDATALADADLEPAFREKPAIHRFPGAMAGRVHELAIHVRDNYDGDAARIWRDAADAGATRLRRDEGEGAWLGPLEAVRRHCRRRSRPSPPNPGRCRLGAGAARLPGRQARAQGQTLESSGLAERVSRRVPAKPAAGLVLAAEAVAQVEAAALLGEGSQPPGR